MTHIKRLIIFAMLSGMPLTSYAQFVLCSSLNRDHIDISYEPNADNQYGTFLTLRPRLRDVPLETHAVDDSLVTVRYNGCFEVFNISAYSGVQAFLADSGETYDGRTNYHHQVIFGGNGNDVIHTGNGVDYVHGLDGDDMLYTHDDHDRIFGGDGIDCGELGTGRPNYSSQLSGVEYDTCTNFYPRPESTNAGLDTQNCDVIDSDFLITGVNNSFHETNTYFEVQPQLGNQKLTAQGDAQQLTLFYNDQCQHFNVSEYNGLMVSLLHSGEEYDGKEVTGVHQLVVGGDGDDIIQTGDGVDFVYAGKGNDKIFTYEDYEKVFGGEGVDCLNQGESRHNMPSSINEIEQPYCAEPFEFDELPDALAVKYASCTVQDYSFYGNVLNNVWHLKANSNGVSINVEHHGAYLVAYSNGYQHCEIIESNIAGIEAILSDGHDTFNSASVNYVTNVYGLRGNDTIVTGDSHDLIFGGGGNDNITANGGNDWVIGDSEIETHLYIYYTAAHGVTNDDGNDTIDGGYGIDVIFGNGRSDTISGGHDADVIFGNTGNNDRLDGNYGQDLVFASATAGTGWGNRTRVWGGSGQDILLCLAGPCSMKGGGSADLLMQLDDEGDIGLYGGDGGDTFWIRSDLAPVGKGGGGYDRCYQPDGGYRCENFDVEYEDDGSLRHPIRNAADRMNAVHETYLQLKSRVSHNTNHAELIEIFDNVVTLDKFNRWLNRRHFNIYQLQ